jgi:hypothetical protein
VDLLLEVGGLLFTSIVCVAAIYEDGIDGALHADLARRLVVAAGRAAEEMPQGTLRRKRVRGIERNFDMRVNPIA